MVLSTVLIAAYDSSGLAFHMVYFAHKLNKQGDNRQCIKKQRHHFADKGLSSQSYGFSSSQEWIWELDHKED